MKRISFSVLLLGAAALLIACGGGSVESPAANSPNAANANAAKPAGSAPSKDALFALDKQANEAFIKGDSKFFEGLLSDKFVTRDGAKRMDKAALVKMIAGLKCEVKTWNLDEEKLSTIDADTYVLSYRGTWDGTCNGPDGKSMKIPSPTRAATVWIRTGDKWQVAFHGGNLIVDTKSPASPQAKKEEPKKADASAPNSADIPAPVKTTGSANTDALVKLELAVWEAWKEQDAKKLQDATTADLSFIDIFGNSYANKVDTIKAWSGAICDVKSVRVTDGAAYALSQTVELLTHTGTADGTCYGQKVGAVRGNSIYVNDGDSWKLAFTMNMPTM